MALRQKVDEVEVARAQEVQIQENLRLARFTDWIKEIRKYLCYQHGEFYMRCSFKGYIIGVPLIIVKDKGDNSYITAFRQQMEKILFDYYEDSDDYYDGASTGRIIDENWWSRYGDEDAHARLGQIIEKINHSQEYDLIHRFDCYAFTTPLKHYIIFWNLFLAAMDDDIYNEQLSTVAELAACFGFDEPMMRDWCRAVEYVFAGNKLSEDCDLECETVEGARFFLHKKEW